MIVEVDRNLSTYFNDDPVRHHLSEEFRMTDNRKSYALVINGDRKPSAMICVAFCEDVPATEEELVKPGNVAVFYTVWSYEKGCGTEIVFEMVDYIKENMPEVNRFVTLSPLTQMARNFHLKNGAVEYRMNETTVNFEYENR